MKIVVLGRADKATKAVENIASDTYHYASNVDDAIEAVEQTVAEMLVIENGHSIKSPLTEIMTELQRMPQDVRLLVLSPSRHYFIVANNTFNSSVNYHITENKPTDNKAE
jgi:hypothetical protein